MMYNPVANFGTHPLVSRAKSKRYKSKKVKTLALDSQLLIVQILTNDVQALILGLSYFITTLRSSSAKKREKEFFRYQVQ